MDEKTNKKVKIKMMTIKLKVRMWNLAIMLNNLLVKLHYINMYDLTGNMTQELQHCHHIKLGWMTYVTFGFLMLLVIVMRLI